MKRAVSVIILLVSMGLISHIDAQLTPGYVFPEDEYTGLDDEMLEHISELGKQVSKGIDPSFESVACIFPHYMDYPKALVGIKEHHGRFWTSWDGSIIFPPFYLSFEVKDLKNRHWFEESVPFSNVDVVKGENDLVGGWLPVINRKFEYDDVTYDQTVMALSENFDTEEPLIAVVRFKVINNTDTTRRHRLSLRFRGTGSRPSSQLWATSGRSIVNCPMRLIQKGNRILNENMDPILWSKGPEGNFGDDVLSFDFNLSKKDGQELLLYIPFEPVKTEVADNNSNIDFEGTFDKVKEYWTDMMDAGTRINVPEQIINEAYKTWHINNFLLVQEDRTRMTYKTIDAPFFYEGIFGYAAAMYLNSITTAGYFDEAKRCAKMFLRLQNDDGSISGVNRSNGIIPHQHGAILYAISQIYRMGRDREWFELVAPGLIRGCEWIRVQRKNNNIKEGELGYGMLPPLRSNVDQGDPVQEFCGNAWCWAGLREVGLALKEFGGKYTEQGENLLQESKTYRDDILATMDLATVREDGLSYIPLNLNVPEPIPYLNKNSKCYYYCWISSRMLESMIFEKDDPRMNAYTNFFEGRKGIILGLVRAGGDNNLGYSAHFSAGYGISNLRMDKMDRFLMTYYSMLAYGMARNLYATQEHDNFLEGFNDPWYYARQPHLHSTSELIRITDKMLVLDDWGKLCLAFGVPRAWLEDGKKIEVSNVQTCYGPVSYEINSNITAGRVNVAIHHKRGEISPEAFLVKLRHPKGKPIIKVEVNGKLYPSYDKEIIDLPGDIEECNMVVYFKK